MKKMIIYAAGGDLKKFLKQHPAAVDYIDKVVDSDTEKQGRMICGIKIESPDCIRQLEENKEVIVSSQYFFREIEEKIRLINDKVCIRRLDKEVLADYLPKPSCHFCYAIPSDWIPTGEDNFTQYPIIGNGWRVSKCPYCGSTDRSRWVYWVLQNKTTLFEDKCSILHFAPERQIEKELREKENIDYYTADIEEGRADYVVDMTDIQFENEKFDYIIANHVLEHIKDEEKAISECKRCLKADGTLILSFPRCMETDTLERDEYDTPSLKRKIYGQEDHVRLYGRDYKKRMEAYGFSVKSYVPNEVLDADTIERCKLIPNDLVIFCKKK